MNFFSFTSWVSLASLAFGLSALAGPAQAEDILSILARKSETPARLAPTTIPYSYTLTLDIKGREGKDLNEVKAVLRVDPNQAPGARVTLITTSDPDSESLRDFVKEIEDPENTVDKQAENFWCGDSEAASDEEANILSDRANITVVYEDDTQAVLRPNMSKLAELLMQSDENADKNGRKMMKKLLKRIEGEITLSKPSAEMMGFSVRMTRPMTMMVVAKLKEMTVEQTCELAANGHYHTSTMKMHVEGKALGTRFGEDIDMRITDLTPLP